MRKSSCAKFEVIRLICSANTILLTILHEIPCNKSVIKAACSGLQSKGKNKKFIQLVGSPHRANPMRKKFNNLSHFKIVIYVRSCLLSFQWETVSEMYQALYQGETCLHNLISSSSITSPPTHYTKKNIFDVEQPLLLLCTT